MTRTKWIRKWMTIAKLGCNIVERMALIPTNSCKVCSKLGLQMDNDKDHDILIRSFNFKGNMYEICTVYH